MSGNEQAFQDAMNQGHTAAWDQDWEGAITFYNMAVNELPDNPNALTNLALAYFELQQYPEALEHYQRVTGLTPDDPVPMQKVADIYEKMGNIDSATQAYMDVAELYASRKETAKAMQSWARVVALNPTHMGAHTRLAVVLERLGRTNAALSEYITVASLLQEQGKIAKAIQTVRHALELAPTNKEANLALGMLQTGRTLPRPAMTSIISELNAYTNGRQVDITTSNGDSASRLDPIQDAKQKAITMLAEFLFEQEEAQSPQATKGLSAILKGRGGIDPEQTEHTKVVLHLSQAIDMLAHNQDEAAAVELDHAMEAGLENSALYYLLGFLESKNGHLEHAIVNLKKSIHHEIFGLGARLLLALTEYKMDLPKDAAIAYLEALRIADAESIPADQAEELIQLYEPLIESFAQNSDATLQKRICENVSKLLIRPDWKTQIQLARRQLPVPADDSGPTPLAEMLTEATSGRLVESLARVNQLARANKLLTAMEEAFYTLEFAPTYLPLHVSIGDLLVKENRVPEAVLKYSTIAKCYSVRGDTNRAISMYRRVNQLNPFNLDARNNLMDLLIAHGNTQEVIQEFIRLAETFYRLANLADARKTYTRALQYAQQYNLDRDTKIKLLNRMADIDSQNLDWRSALKEHEQIRVLDPEDKKSRDMLFDLNISLGQPNKAISELDNYLNLPLNARRVDDALEYVSAKIEDNKSQPALYRRLAELYRLKGRTEDAIQQLELAKELYLQSGNRTTALECVRAILALNPRDVAVYQKELQDIQAQENSGH